MKLTPIFKRDKDFDWWGKDFPFDDWMDFPISKFGKNMQRMKTDIIETEKEYHLKIDVPGYNKDELKIHIGDNYLTVYAIREEQKQDLDTKGEYVHRERFLGTVSRSFYIGNLHEDKIKARYENGTLHITMAKGKGKEAERKYLKID